MGIFTVGVDVGTGSARAGVFDAAGTLLAVDKRPITTWSTAPEHHTQSSAEIWEMVCAAVHGAVAAAAVDPGDAVGLAFDATCSLVCLDAAGNAVGVDAGEPSLDERNIILWADHRAVEQASRINSTGHRCLRMVGGVISPEMEIPKILWLRQHMPEAYRRVVDGGRFYDLADYLTARAAGSACVPRSLCTVVCKWNYDANADGTGAGWDRGFLAAAGFEDGELTPDVIGESVASPGISIAGGVGEDAAAALGLRAGTALAVGMIDAHAGGVGCLGAGLPSDRVKALEELECRLALVCGTSTCHMASSRKACFVGGVWGPCYGAMFDGLHLNEGGQSAAGVRTPSIQSQSRRGHRSSNSRRRSLAIPSDPFRSLPIPSDPFRSLPIPR